jgi:hypothetical protein
MSLVDKIGEFLEKVEGKDIIFKKHFNDRIKERPISKELVKRYLKNKRKLIKIEEQQTKREGEQKYKLWFKMSNKYDLITIVAKTEKTLYIITAWNTNRRWQKAIQK